MRGGRPAIDPDVALLEDLGVALAAADAAAAVTLAWFGDRVPVELKADAPKVDPLRRQLQRSYVEILRREFQPADSAW